MPLSQEDQKHLLAAQGYLELGMFLEGNGELEEIDAGCRHLAEVLAVRVGIYSGLEKWDLMEVVARKLVSNSPEDPQSWTSWAYATRRAESIEAAKAILTEAAQRHPDVALIHYNLACYECQMGDFGTAKGYLVRAFELEPQYRMMALEDEDLKPLWDSL
jgi:tetratricopeptide (TPR) repeat protein